MANYEPRLLKDYKKAVPEIMKELQLGNIMQVPRIEKIVVNIGQGEAVQNIKVLESAYTDLQAVTGQKPVMTKATKSIAGFKVRKGMPIGCMVTLRGHRMYEFLDRLINIAVPRIRDFRGYSTKSFDGRGNFSLGVKEQIVFPEIDYDKVDKVRGMSISIGTSARNDTEARVLLEKLNFPFRKS